MTTLCSKCTKTDATMEVTGIRWNGTKTLSLLCGKCYDTDKWSWLDYYLYITTPVQQETTKDTYTPIHTHLSTIQSHPEDTIYTTV